MPTELTCWMLLAQNGGPERLWWVPLLIIGVLFYFMLIRPEKRKRAELNEMLRNLKKNDRVVTIGGIHGTIVNVQEGSEEVTIRVDENTNTRLRVQRNSVAQVVTAKETSDSSESGK
jgi:preprotein translocase subunit YajC